MPLFLVFIIIPVIEILLFIEIGSQIGTMWTIISVLATAFIGTFLVKKQGLQVLQNAQENLGQNQMPIKEIFSGICILVAGAFLLTPGFLTDSIGFLLLFPPFRSYAGGKIISLFKKSGKFAHFQASHSEHHYHHPHSPFGHSHTRPTDDGVIDGEYEIVDPDQQPKDPYKKPDNLIPKD